MASDILRDLGPVFLGSRLKRLAERMQAGAAGILAEAGLPLQPAQAPLLAALEQGPLTVGELVDTVGYSQPAITRAAGQLVSLGLVRSERGADQRRRTLSLTPAGEAAMVRIRRLVWPRIGEAVSALLDGLSGPLLDQVAGIEAALAAQSLDARVAALAPAGLVIRDFADELATASTTSMPSGSRRCSSWSRPTGRCSSSRANGSSIRVARSCSSRRRVSA